MTASVPLGAANVPAAPPGAAPARSPVPEPPAPTVAGEILAEAEGRAACPDGLLPRTELSGLLRALIEEPTLQTRLRGDPVLGPAASQVDAWVAAVEAVLRGDVARLGAAVDAGLAASAPWMPLASGELAQRRGELVRRREAPGDPGGIVGAIAAASALRGADALADGLARAARDQVLGLARGEASRLSRRLLEAPGAVRRTQAWATASRDAARVLAQVSEWEREAPADAARAVEDALRLLSAHADTLDLMEREELDRVQREGVDRDRRVREDRIALDAAHARLPRVHFLLTAAIAAAILLGALAPGPLLVLSGVPVVLAMLDLREVSGDLRGRVWTMPRADVDDLANDVGIRFAVAVLLLAFLGIALLALAALGRFV